MQDTDALINTLVAGDEDAVLKALSSANPEVVATIKTAAAKVDKTNLENKKQEAFNSLGPVFDSLRTEVEAATLESFSNEKDLKVEVVVTLRNGVATSAVKARKKGIKHPLVMGTNGTMTLQDFADFGRNKREVKSE